MDFKKIYQQMSLNHRVRLFLILAVFIVWLLLFMNYFVIFGSKTIAVNFSNDNLPLKISPYDRVGEKICENGDCYRVFKREPFYFNVWSPADFKTGKMSVSYKVENQDQVIFLAPQNSNTNLAQKIILYDNYLQDLFSNEAYSVINEKDLYLFQKENNYDNIAQFLENLPLTSNLAVYNYDLQLASDSYQVKLNKALSVTPYLQGTHDFLVYIDEITADKSLVFTFVDLQSRNIENEITITVKQNNSLIYSNNLSLNNDEGAETEEKVLVKNLEFVLDNEQLEIGEYEIEVIASNDIILTAIESSWPLLVKGDLRFAPSSELEKLSTKNIFVKQTLYTNAKEIDAQIFEKKDSQKIIIDNRPYDLNVILKIYHSVFDSNKEKKIQITSPGTYLQTNDFWSFNEPCNWKKQIINLDNNINEEVPDFDYLIVNYNKPQMLEDGWFKNELEFNLNDDSSRQNMWIFSFQMPGMERVGGLLKMTDFYLKLKK